MALLSGPVFGFAWSGLVWSGLVWSGSYICVFVCLLALPCLHVVWFSLVVYHCTLSCLVKRKADSYWEKIEVDEFIPSQPVSNEKEAAKANTNHISEPET
jgi:hypothetical protein